MSAASFSYGATLALSNITVSLPPGQVTAVVGGDGAGKTTVIEALAGRITPSAGQVRRPATRLTGLQPASSGVWADLSVRENLAFTGKAYAMSRNEIAQRSAGLLTRAGLSGTGDRLGRQLSGGMRQKLGFVLAALHRPSLLLLDEPTTGVDPVSRVELWRLIAQAAADGATVVMATTYLDEAERASQVLVLDSGHALATGTPEQILAAVPGTVTRSDTRPDAPGRTWRRGTGFRTWYPPASAIAGTPAEPDMEDAVVALTLARAAQAQAREGSEEQ